MRETEHQEKLKKKPFCKHPEITTVAEENLLVLFFQLPLKHETKIKKYYILMHGFSKYLESFQRY